MSREELEEEEGRSFLEKVIDRVDPAVGEQLADTIRSAATKGLKRPGLILPDIPLGGAPILRDNYRDLRVELGLEDEFPTIEEVEDALRDLDSSDIINEFIDEWEQEMQDLIDELEEEAEDLLEESEDDLPDVIEENEEQVNEEGKKCWAMTISIGDAKITFGTCEKETTEDDSDSSDGIDLDKINEDLMDDLGGRGCIVSYTILTYLTMSGTAGEDSSMSFSAPPCPHEVEVRGAATLPVKIWSPTKNRYGHRMSVRAAQSDGGWIYRSHSGWYKESGEQTDAPEFPYFYVNCAIAYWTAYLDLSTGSIRYYANGNLNNYGERFTSLFPGEEYEGAFGSIPGDALFVSEPRGSCIPPGYPGGNNNDKDKNNFPNIITEKKDKDKNMDKECCKATLSILRKMYNALGGAEESQYPYGLVVENDESIQINNIKDRVDAIQPGQGQQGEVNNNLLQEIANVTGVSPVPVYPRTPEEGEEEITNIAEEIQRKSNQGDLLEKVANVIGTSETPLYPVGDGEDEITNITEEFRESKDKDSEIISTIANVTGANDNDTLTGYPAKLPKTMLGVVGEQVSVKNTPELILYLFKYIDSVVGQYPVPIKIQDTDPTTEGDQSEEKKVPNISELLAELYGLVYMNMINIKDERLGVGSATELYFLKKNLFQQGYKIDAITEWLGIDPETVTRKLKFSVTPGEREYNKFLQPSKEDVEVVEFKESKNNKDLRYYLDKLLIAATTVQQVYGIPIDRNNITGSILGFIRGLGVNPGEEWEQFKDDLENGKLTDDNLGISDNPKIKSPMMGDNLES